MSLTEFSEVTWTEFSEVTWMEFSGRAAWQEIFAEIEFQQMPQVPSISTR